MPPRSRTYWYAQSSRSRRPHAGQCQLTLRAMPGPFTWRNSPWIGAEAEHSVAPVSRAGCSMRQRMLQRGPGSFLGRTNRDPHLRVQRFLLHPQMWGMGRLGRRGVSVAHVPIVRESVPCARDAGKCDTSDDAAGDTSLRSSGDRHSCCMNNIPARTHKSSHTALEWHSSTRTRAARKSRRPALPVRVKSGRYAESKSERPCTDPEPLPGARAPSLLRARRRRVPGRETSRAALTGRKPRAPGAAESRSSRSRARISTRGSRPE